jgi:hypothetical protein
MADSSSFSSSSNLPVKAEEVKKPWYEGRVGKQPTERETLLPWHTVAIIRHHLYNEQWKDIAKIFKCSANYISRVGKSPAGRRLKTRLEEGISDPVEFAKEVAQANALDVTLDRYMALEWAKEEGDAKLVDSIAKDLAAIGGVQPEPKKVEKAETVQPTIHIHLPSESLELPSVEASYEVIEDESDDDE